MRKVHSFCARIFHHAVGLIRSRLRQKAVLSAVSALFESLEHRTFMSASAYSDSVSFANGLLTVQGSSSLGSSLTVNLVNNGNSIDASGDRGHSIILPRAEVRAIHVTGGSGSDYIYIDSRIILPTTINGGNGNDVIRGGGGGNTILDGNGNDWISARGTSDNVLAGNGNDTLLGGTGDCRLVAGNGNDSIIGLSGNDVLIAGNGSNTLQGGSGNDTLTTGIGRDFISSGSGDNLVTVGNGFSTVYPGTGTNRLVLGGSKPIVIASDGDNTIVRSGKTVSPVSTAPGKSAPSSPVAIATTPVTPASLKPSVSTTVAVPTPTSQVSSIPVLSVSPASAAADAPVAANRPLFAVSHASVARQLSVGTDSWASNSAASAAGTAPQAVMQVMAPEPYVGIAVLGRALNTVLGSGSYIDANYQWDFGDPSSQFNWLNGFNANHVYTQPGTYTITLYVTNNLNQASSVSSSITIYPDSRRAIYVNAATGNDNNNGSSSNNPVQSATRALALVGNNTDVFFERGQEFNLGQAFKLNYSNVVVGAYGSGANPIINYTAPATGAVIFTTNSSSANGVTIENLTMTTLDGTQPNNTKMPMAVMAGGHDTSVLSCTFDYVEYDINASAGPVGLTAIGNSSPILGGLQGYFLWSEASDATVLGNYVYGSVHEHVIRTSGANEMLIGYNNFSNFDGKGCIEVHEGSLAWVDGNIVNGGDIRVGPLGLWGEPVSVGTSDAVVQNNTVNNTDIAIYPGSHDVSIRNNVISRNSNNMIDLIGEDGLGRQSSDIRILNNTGLSSGATGQFLVVQNHVNGILLENNLLVQPSLATGGYLTAPVYVTEANLSSFTYINGNVWQQPTTIYKYAQGGINFVATSYAVNGYLTASAWNSQPQVGTDYFTGTSMNWITPTGGQALYIDSAVAGVFSDIRQDSRPSNGGWTAGAVQV